MNRDILIATVGFLAGTLFGGSVAYLLVKERFAAMATADIAEMRDYYENKRYYNMVVTEAKEGGEPEEDGPDAEDIISAQHYSTSSIDTEALREKLQKKPEKTEEVVDRKKPYVITDISYHEEFDHHEKVSWTWYEDDDTLSDEADNPIDGRYNIIPMGALDELTSRNRTIYIRNENLSVDIEVSYRGGSYTAEVWGLDSEEKPPKVRKMRPQDE